MSKDPFQILADEVTLIRGEIERLQRTSLDKNEAKALHKVVAKGVADINAVLPTLERSIERQLFDNREIIREEAVIAARDASAIAISKNHYLIAESAEKLLRNAGEARREAWRYFGGFWVWIVSVGALGVVLGALTVVAITARADAKDFGKYPGVYCDTAGGRKVTGTDGTNYCAIPLD